jgi:two-component system response regulator NreC
MSSERIRILLADDHQVLRDGLRALLESETDLGVVGEASTGQEAVELARRLAPDIILMDLGMPGLSGLDAIRAIRAERPAARIIVLSMHAGREIVMQAIQAGCDGYVPKSAAHTSLLQAIRTVHAGQRFLDPAATTAVLDELVDQHREAQLSEQLSDREREIVRMTALGFTSREIGEQLALSPKTVDTYRLRAMEKLGLEHRSELVRFALRAGLLEDFPPAH